MNIEFLRTFLVLVEQHNFTRTAQLMMLSQSTVSGRIRELETEIGFKLIERNSKKSFRLTPQGTAFVPYAKQIVELESETLNNLKLFSRFSNMLTVGVTFNLYDFFLEKYFCQFAQTHPEIALNIKMNASEELFIGLGKQDYDLVFFYYQYFHPNYICEPFMSEEIILATNSLNQEYREGIPSKKLMELPIIYNYFLDSVLPKDKAYPLQLNIASKTIPFLKTGKYYALVPKDNILDELKQNVLIEIPLLDIKLPKKESYLVYKRQYKDDKQVSDFIQLTKSQITDDGKETLHDI